MNRERPLEHTYTLLCAAGRSPSGEWCQETFVWTGDLPADAGAREAQVEALRAAVAAGWRVEQDHDGHVRAFCPGVEPLPADILRGRS